MKEFHQQLKQAMNLRNMSQSELCAKTGIPKSAMSQYISGAFKPKQERTYLIAKVLNVNEAWLMGYDDADMEETKPYNRKLISLARLENEEISEEEDKEISAFIDFLKSKRKN